MSMYIPKNEAEANTGVGCAKCWFRYVFGISGSAISGMPAWTAAFCNLPPVRICVSVIDESGKPFFRQRVAIARCSR